MSKVFKSFFGRAKSGPSQAEIIAQQEAAATAERERIEAETAEKELSAFTESQSRRQAFTANVAEDEALEDEARRKFLKKV